MTDKFLDQIKIVGENNDNKLENNWYVFDDWILNNGNYFSVMPKLIDIKDPKNFYEEIRFDSIVSFNCSIKIKQNGIFKCRSE